jgi:cytochrome P450
MQPPKPRLGHDPGELCRHSSLLGLLRILMNLRRVDAYIRRRIEAAKAEPEEGLISALIASRKRGTTSRRTKRQR